MSPIREKRRFARAARWLVFLVALGLAGLFYLSQQMVAPPRPRVASSERPVLGVALRAVAGRSGLTVEAAMPPASSAGIAVNDRIISLDGAPVDTLEAFAEQVQASPAGTLFRIEARRPDPSGGEGGVLIEVPSTSRKVSPADLGLLYEEIEFTNPYGQVLRGWYVSPPASDRAAPGIAYGHGNGGDRRQWLFFAREAHEAGFGQILFDFAGRGESDGDVITLGARESGDLRSALDWMARRREIDPSRLALAGRSMGGAAAILEAASDPRVKAIVLDSPFADLSEVVDDALYGRFLPAPLIRPALFALAGWRATYDPSTVRPVEAIRRIGSPILLLHGDKDEVVPFRHAEALREAARERLTLVKLEGLDHNSARPPEVVRQMVEFLRKVAQ